MFAVTADVWLIAKGKNAREKKCGSRTFKGWNVCGEVSENKLERSDKPQAVRVRCNTKKERLATALLR